MFPFGGRWSELVSCGVVGREIDGEAQAPFDDTVGPVMQHVELPCTRVVVVIAHVRGGRLVDGKGNERGLGIPKVV